MLSKHWNVFKILKCCQNKLPISIPTKNERIKRKRYVTTLHRRTDWGSRPLQPAWPRPPPAPRTGKSCLTATNLRRTNILWDLSNCKCSNKYLMKLEQMLDESKYLVRLEQLQMLDENKTHPHSSLPFPLQLPPPPAQNHGENADQMDLKDWKRHRGEYWHNLANDVDKKGDNDGKEGGWGQHCRACWKLGFVALLISSLQNVSRPPGDVQAQALVGGWLRIEGSGGGG